jgi:transcriptional regulator with GAF, ATPase, and Fis domain
MAAANAAQNYLPVRTRMLIASADPQFRKRVMKESRCSEAYCEEAVGGAHALAKLKNMMCDNVLLDLNLPDLDSAELARLILKRYPEIEVGFIDSHMHAGTERETEDVATRAGGEEQSVAGMEETEWPEPAVEEPLTGMVGTSRAMQKVYQLVRMVAQRDTAVLITGETGTGKELVAEAIHKMSRRSRKAFVVVNCAAIPEALFEAELFGHARGAFTGAIQSRLGRVHMAQGGTLFLDEIGELPLSMQAKLLRFLQNGEVQRLGSSDVYRVDVRVICATNVQLAELMRAKQFRQDLFYRMAVFPIAVPPLRERAEDIGALAAHFFKELCRDIDLPEKCLTTAALEFLQQREWAGNVRELQHVLERSFIFSGNASQILQEHFGERVGTCGCRER